MTPIDFLGWTATAVFVSSYFYTGATGLRRTQGTAIGLGSFFGVRVKASVPIVAYQGHFDSGLGGGFGTLGTALGTTGVPA